MSQLTNVSEFTRNSQWNNQQRTMIYRLKATEQQKQVHRANPDKTFSPISPEYLSERRQFADSADWKGFYGQNTRRNVVPLHQHGKNQQPDRDHL